MSYSENEDDPAVYESSGDEWDESMEVEKKRNMRRTSQRLSKKPRITHRKDITSSEDSDEEEEEEDEAPEEEEEEDDDEDTNKSNGVRKTKKSPPKPVANKPPMIQSNSKPANTASQNHNFSTGSFVILKKDAHGGTSSNPPCIWKIDGKALLQKYEPYEEDGKVKHRNTSIYTGWSSLDKDQYSAVQVQVASHAGQKMVVELNWDELKTINIDSD